MVHWEVFRISISYLLEAGAFSRYFWEHGATKNYVTMDYEKIDWYYVDYFESDYVMSNCIIVYYEEGKTSPTLEILKTV